MTRLTCSLPTPGCRIRPPSERGEVWDTCCPGAWSLAIRAPCNPDVRRDAPPGRRLYVAAIDQSHDREEVVTLRIHRPHRIQNDCQDLAEDVNRARVSSEPFLWNSALCAW